MDYYFSAHKMPYKRLSRDKKVEAADVLLYENCHKEYPREAKFAGEYLQTVFRTKKDNTFLDELDYKGLLEAWYLYEDGETAENSLELAWSRLQERNEIW